MKRVAANRLLVFYFVTVSFVFSCTYDSREDLEVVICDTNGVSYTDSIVPIIRDNCVTCHSTNNPAGNLNFESHAGISAVANNGRLLGAIKHLPGYFPMPQFSPMLPDCQISKIQQWVEGGAPNN